MPDKLDLVTHLVTSYLSHNRLPAADVPALIGAVNAAIGGLGQPVAPPPQEPAVSIRASVKQDSIACLECGERFRTLKRHLMTEHELTVDQYRSKWELSTDYPMVAPEYSRVRAQAAKRMGLGRKPSPAGGRNKQAAPRGARAS